MSLYTGGSGLTPSSSASAVATASDITPRSSPSGRMTRMIELEDGTAPELRQIEECFPRSLVGAVGAGPQADALVGEPLQQLGRVSTGRQRRPEVGNHGRARGAQRNRLRLGGQGGGSFQ